MAIHVTPHDHVEHESAYVNAAESIIKSRAMEKKLREFIAANQDGEALIKFIASKAFTWATDYDWAKSYNNIHGLTPRNFFDKIHLSVLEWGAPTQGQADAVRRIMAQDAEKKAQWAARDAQSQHIGAVGDKIEVEAVVTFQTSFENAFGYTTITGFRSGDNVIIHKGTPPKIDDAEPNESNSHYDWNTNKWIQHSFKREVKKGDRVILKGTVKAHGERGGVKQTVVTRPKATKVEAE
jgi:hypothetical protein